MREQPKPFSWETANQYVERTGYMPPFFDLAQVERKRWTGGWALRCMAEAEKLEIARWAQGAMVEAEKMDVARFQQSNAKPGVERMKAGSDEATKRRSDEG